MSCSSRSVTTLQAALWTTAWLAVFCPRPALPSAATVPPLQLDCAAGLPFTEQDLAAAVELRVEVRPTAGYGVRVRALGGGTVEVSLGNKRRAVTVGERRGSAAARWVALTVADLIMEEAAPTLLPQASPPALSAAPPRLLFMLFPAIGLGTGTSLLSATGGIGSSVGLYRGLRWTADLGYGGSPVTTFDNLTIAIQTLPLRSGPAFYPARWPVEVQLSAVITPYWVHATAGSNAVQHTGVVIGCGTALLAYLPGYRRLRTLLALGLDLFASRAEFLYQGQPVFATARFTAWLGAGLALRSM